MTGPFFDETILSGVDRFLWMLGVEHESNLKRSRSSSDENSSTFLDAECQTFVIPKKDCATATTINHQSSSSLGVERETIKEETRSKVLIRTEWSLTKINVFDDNSRIYEVMKPTTTKLENFQSNESIQNVFAVLPNGVTICYFPLSE